MDRTDAACREMLEFSGFIYNAPRDAYTSAQGRALRVETILAHTQVWVAQWITETLPPDAVLAKRSTPGR
jgi:hypothetical protein